jgi:hypothetical protein
MAVMSSTQRDQGDLIRCRMPPSNARDLDAALAGMHPEVDWPNAIDCVRGGDARVVGRGVRI